MPESEPVIVQRECKVCGYQWYPRSPERPRICPRCKSARWDVGRRFPPRLPQAQAALA